jgi:exodeoxyribonuclease V alpha subunit
VGDVLAELVEAARGPAPELSASWVHLTEARRFKERPGILSLARALEDRDADAAVDLLKGLTDASGGVSWISGECDRPAWNTLPEAIRTALEAIAHAPTPEAALSALGRVCLLTAHREYLVGAKVLGQMIEEHFLASGITAFNHPVIIDRNDPETGLKNGSVGVVCPLADGSRLAYFPALKEGDPLREFPIARLPEHSPAWALTIHRSQGSEFDEVFVALPQHESPLATRELIYTAITRARWTVHIAGDLETIRRAVGRAGRRITLVGHQLAAICRIKASSPGAG